MHATCPEDLQILQRGRRLMVEIFAITEGFRDDAWLRDQLNESVESVVSNIAEGYRQPTDRAFARYLAIAAGSGEELRVHLEAAGLRRAIPRPRVAELMAEAREIVNMIGAFIGYLRRCDRKDRCKGHD
jgi:four helix bundle protein